MSKPNALPPGPDENQGPALLAGITTLQVISFALFATRIYTRTTPRVKLWWCDFFIGLAMLFNWAEYALIIASVYYGLGRHNYYVRPDVAMNGEKYLFLSQPFYPWALVCAKISIVCMLLRVLWDRVAWRWFLYAMLALQLGIGITMNYFQLSLCKPLAAVWDHTIPNPVCEDVKMAQASIYATAALIILTDVILSLIPLTFILQLQRPVRERIAIACIMSMGLVASAGSIYKITLIMNYGITGDTLWDGVGLTMWSFVEMQLGIMAACIPALKQLFEKILGRIGLLSSRHPSNPRSGYENQADVQLDSQLSSPGLPKLRTIRSTTTVSAYGKHGSFDSDPEATGQSGDEFMYGTYPKLRTEVQAGRR